MSPRAAWRLEALGFGDVYDYVTGKVDWRAAGLPTEGSGQRPARVTAAMDPTPPTCRPDDDVASVVEQWAGKGSAVVVVVDEGGVVHGKLRLDRIVVAAGGVVGDVMEVGPTTIRADADLAEMVDRMQRRGADHLIVSTPDGVLLGVLHRP